MIIAILVTRQGFFVTSNVSIGFTLGEQRFYRRNWVQLVNSQSTQSNSNFQHSNVAQSATSPKIHERNSMTRKLPMIQMLQMTETLNIARLNMWHWHWPVIGGLGSHWLMTASPTPGYYVSFSECILSLGKPSKMVTFVNSLITFAFGSELALDPNKRL